MKTWYVPYEQGLRMPRSARRRSRTQLYLVDAELIEPAEAA